MKRSLPIIVYFVLVAGAAAIVWQTSGRRGLDPAAEQNTTPALNIRPDLATEFAPLVRVNLTPRPVDRLRLAIDGPYVIRPVGSERLLGRGARLDQSELTATAAGFRFGGEEYQTTRLEVVPEDSPAVWVNDHKYRGSVRFYRRAQGTILAVNVLPLEDYIASVVDSEMPRAFPSAARRAQAIASRSYALYQMRRVSSQSHFDLYATTRSQNYLGVEYRDSGGRRLAGESAASRQIALETAGSVCTWQGQLFCTYYSAVCGGRTTAGKDVFTDAAPPLKSVPCEWCSAAKYYRWNTRLSQSAATDSLHKYFTELGKPFDSLTTITRKQSRTPLIPDFEVSDGRHRHTVSAVALRRRFPPATLYSPRFTVEQQTDELRFSGRGHGHGVGLCQWGARGLAEAGKNCLEIINYYYPGAKIVVIDAKK